MSIEKEREELQKIKEKSEDNFEKNITYICAGGLALSLTFFEKVLNYKTAICPGFLIVSWGLFTFTLLVNLLSHYLSSYFHEKSMDEFDKEDKDVEKNMDQRNSYMRRINITTIITLILAIIF